MERHSGKIRKKPLFNGEKADLDMRGLKKVQI
jgi:hypothetical protein